jgi:hypothetical protein
MTMQLGIKYWAIDLLNTEKTKYIQEQRYITLINFGKYHLNVLYGLRKNECK